MANYPGDPASLYDAVESGAEAIYAGPNTLVSFSMPGGALYVQEHHEHANSLDSAERASIAEIERRTVEKSGYGFAVKEVPMDQAIGPGFACDPEHPRAECRFLAKGIVSISREGENWRLVVRNRWDQEITLDARFDLVSTRRLPETK